MAKVGITRKYSTFQNIDDQMLVGNFEADGHAAYEEYDLPEGYAVNEGTIIDPDGYECDIFPTAKGMRISSVAGRCPDKLVFPK